MTSKYVVLSFQMPTYSYIGVPIYFDSTMTEKNDPTPFRAQIEAPCWLSLYPFLEMSTYG